MRLACSVLVVSILVAAAPVARAESEGGGADAIARGRALVRSFEYDAALSELESVLANPTSTAPERIQALELMALLQMNLRRQAQAQELFERLLNLDPGHELTDPELPPRAEELFAKTRSGFVASARTTVEARADGTAGGSVDVEADAGGSTDGVERAVAYLRGPGESTYRRALMTRDGLSFAASVPAPLTGALEYYVEVQAPSGYTLASAGSADAPLRAELAPAPDVAEAPPDDSDEGETPRPSGERRRWYRSWWFWTIVGVAVAGGAATATAVVLTQPEEQPHGSLGSLDLP
jgi:tetratricopeptide (TPR) repeat protein